MQDYEKLGVFYLGKTYDPERRAVTDDLILYDSKDLVTHAVCIGMTGSGKTGLCLSLLEEALIDGIPALIVDPKGDLANLLLTFPELRPEDFAPWVDLEDARRKGLSPEAFAAAQAETWTKGLAEWGQDGDRIRRLRGGRLVIYTPGKQCRATARSAQVIQCSAGSNSRRCRSAARTHQCNCYESARACRDRRRSDAQP
jgi:hypothetical protein